MTYRNLVIGIHRAVESKQGRGYDYSELLEKNSAKYCLYVSFAVNAVTSFFRRPAANDFATAEF